MTPDLASLTPLTASLPGWVGPVALVAAVAAAALVAAHAALSLIHGTEDDQ